MAKKPISDSPKIMDVNKPGKGKVMATSRPIVSAVVNEDASDNIINVKTLGKAEPAKAPSSHKVIEPLSSISDANEDTPPEESVVDTIPVEGAIEDEAAQPVDSSVETDQVSEAETKQEEQADPITSEPEEENADTTESDAGAEAGKEKSESAEVDAIAADVETKKQAKKKAEEQAIQDAEVQSLIDSKQYFVKLGKDSSKKSNTIKIILIGVVIFLVILVGGYIAVDAKVIDNDIKLPYEFFKQEQKTPAAQVAPKEDKTDKNVSKPSDEKKTAEATNEEKVTNQKRADDVERKNELKNLQQQLETYFNDNDEYPATLSALVPTPGQENVTGPDGDAYTYEVTPDGQLYVLTAKLVNPDDKDANSQGLFILYSVNQ